MSLVRASVLAAGLLAFARLARADAPTLSYDAGNPVAGDTIYLQTQVSGGNDPYGTLTFTIYDAGEDCSGAVIATGQVPVHGDGFYGTDPFPVNNAGTHYFSVVYSGDDNNDPVYDICNNSFDVAKAEASLTVTDTSQTYNGAPHHPTVTVAPSNLNVVVTYDSSTAEPTNAGTYQLYVSINDRNYQGDFTGYFIIDRAAQTISFPSIADHFDNDPPFPLNVSASSGLPISFEVLSGPPVSIDSNGVVTLAGVGASAIRAKQSGNQNFLPATSVDRTLTVYSASPQLLFYISAHVILGQNGEYSFGPVAPPDPVTGHYTLQNYGGGQLTGLATTIDGPDAAAFTVTTAPTPPLNHLQTTDLAVQFAPTRPGSHTATLHIASNDPTNPTFNITLDGYSYTYQQAWRVKYFSTPDNTGVAADISDPDHDGVPNLLEFATGTIPTAGGGPPGLPATINSTQTFTYSRAKGALADGVIFAVEWSSTPTGNNWSSAGVTDVVTGETADVEIHRATVPANGTTFVRLKVTGP